jgi:succinyl-CoA synthetase beta subunit
MNIHEYQAKVILREYGVSVPIGEMTDDASKIQEIIGRLKGDRWVVKAQIHAGGRGKAGGVKIAKTPEEAERYAMDMLGSVLVTHQTGPAGRMVRKVYIEQPSDIAKEYYLSLILNRKLGKLSVIVSQEGGMDIEEVAAHNPEKIINLTIDPAYGLYDFHCRKLAFALGFKGDQVKKFTKFLNGLYQAYLHTDASQIEINPMILTKDGEIMALDAKINFDDNALFRHAQIEKLRDEHEENPLETKAASFGLNYVKMDGEIGCMVNGAGLAMATMDIIKLYGSEPANFLDVGGGATKERVTEAFKIILSDPNVKGVFVNIFGGIMRCDIIADGIITAAKDMNIKVPLVVRLAGTNVELGKEMLSKSGLAILPASDLADAAEKIVKQLKGG